MDALCERSRLRSSRTWTCWTRSRTPDFSGGAGRGRERRCSRASQGGRAEFCDRLSRRPASCLVPGTFFEVEGQHIRFGYGRRNLLQVLPLLEDWLAGQGSGG
ncbi:MAG: hypothetical protein MZV49_08840 [Rhodopseudomonas palustris]|nr:hypothetical protein [Rhodopseudomonas palustris]